MACFGNYQICQDTPYSKQASIYIKKRVVNKNYGQAPKKIDNEHR